VSRIGADLGWTPATPLEAGLAAMWSWASDTVAAE
jgi:nucleoside-diphosphate-sugar epimerase